MLVPNEEPKKPRNPRKPSKPKEPTNKPQGRSRYVRPRSRLVRTAQCR